MTARSHRGVGTVSTAPIHTTRGRGVARIRRGVDRARVRVSEARSGRWALPVTILTAALVVMGSAPDVAGQGPSPTQGPRMHAGGSLMLAQPVGDFDRYVGLGGGIDGFFRVALDEADVVSLRIQAGFVNYGNETKRVCLSQTVGCRIQVDLTTSNNIVLFGVGPELGVPAGPLRLYANGTIGFSYFSTDSHVSGDLDPGPFASTRNFGDGGFAWTGGGGLQVHLADTGGGASIGLDMGVSYQGNGRREYLTEGDITDLPDGSIRLDVRRSRANLLLWRLGVTVGFGGGDGMRRGR